MRGRYRMAAEPGSVQCTAEGGEQAMFTMGASLRTDDFFLAPSPSTSEQSSYSVGAEEMINSQLDAKIDSI